MREIEAAGTRTVVHPTGPEQWWPELIRQYGGEGEMFDALKVNKTLFYDVMALVDNVPEERRGRRGMIKSNREKLLFLMVYMSRGSVS